MSRRNPSHQAALASRRLQEQIKRETAEQQDNALPLCSACQTLRGRPLSIMEEILVRWGLPLDFLNPAGLDRLDMEVLVSRAKSRLKDGIASSAQLHRAAVHVGFLTLQAEHDVRLQDIARESRLRMAWRRP